MIVCLASCHGVLCILDGRCTSFPRDVKFVFSMAPHSDDDTLVGSWKENEGAESSKCRSGQISLCSAIQVCFLPNFPLYVAVEKL